MSSLKTPYAISIVLHQDQKPGWRIHLNPEDDIGGHAISIKQAEELARIATDILSPVQNDTRMTPFMVIRNGTTALRSTLENELAEAEAKAANIASLRKSLSEIN